MQKNNHILHGKKFLKEFRYQIEFLKMIDKTYVVNINTADMKELMYIDGIGEKLAKAIVDFRNENGSFKTIEDIKNVNGIGSKTFEKIKNRITVAD